MKPGLKCWSTDSPVLLLITFNLNPSLGGGKGWGGGQMVKGDYQRGLSILYDVFYPNLFTAAPAAQKFFWVGAKPRCPSQQVSDGETNKQKPAN